MKKILLTAVLSIVIVLTSCKTDEQYENLNRDPKNPTQVAADFLFNSATKSLIDQMTQINVNRNSFRFFAQYSTTTTYTEEPNFDLVTRTIPGYHWSEMYRDVLLDLQTSKEVAMADAALSGAEQTARTSQAEVLMIYTYQQMVDTWGDIPYSEALSDVTLPEIFDDYSKESIRPMNKQQGVKLIQAIKLVSSFLLYNQITQDKFLVDGFPEAFSKKPKRLGLMKRDMSLVRGCSFSVDAPKNNSKKSHHIRVGHYRQLMNVRYYQGEYENWERGSRWIPVNPSIIGGGEAHTQLSQ